VTPFAWLYAILAAEKGDYGPLDVLLGDPTVILNMEVRNFIRTNGFKPPGRKRGPKPRYHVTTRSKSLEVARTFIRLSNGDGPRLVKGAVKQAAEKHLCSESTVRKTHLPDARLFDDGNWWANNCRLVRKGKGHKLL
jgi:hypothetical protein